MKKNQPTTPIPPEVAEHAPRGACFLCRFFHYEGGKNGQCRRSPPTASGFPKPEVTTWCGEFNWSGKDPATMSESLPQEPKILSGKRDEIRAIKGIGVKTMALIDEKMSKCEGWM